MKKSKMTASGLRAMLITIIIISTLLVGVGFYFAQSQLKLYAVSVSHKIADSTATAHDVQSLQKIQKELSNQQGAQVKASLIASSKANYQTQVVTDIEAYSAQTGVQVQNYSFTPAAAVATATAASPAVGVTALNSAFQTVTVTLNSPVSYTKLLKFISAIEHNLPKMQISNISLSRATSAGSSSDFVTTDTLTIAVYTQ